MAIFFKPRPIKAIHSSHGFEPRVLLLSYEQFRTAITRCPFQPTEAEYRTVHVFFLFEPAAQPDCEGMAAIRAEDENYLLKRNAFPTAFLADSLPCLDKDFSNASIKSPCSEDKKLSMSTSPNWRHPIGNNVLETISGVT